MHIGKSLRQWIDDPDTKLRTMKRNAGKVHNLGYIGAMEDVLVLTDEDWQPTPIIKRFESHRRRVCVRPIRACICVFAHLCSPALSRENVWRFWPVRDLTGLQRIQRYLITYIGHLRTKYSEENS